MNILINESKGSRPNIFLLLVQTLTIQVSFHTTVNMTPKKYKRVVNSIKEDGVWIQTVDTVPVDSDDDETSSSWTPPTDAEINKLMSLSQWLNMSSVKCEKVDI